MQDAGFRRLLAIRRHPDPATSGHCPRSQTDLLTRAYQPSHAPTQERRSEPYRVSHVRYAISVRSTSYDGLCGAISPRDRIWKHPVTHGICRFGYPAVVTVNSGLPAH